MLFHSGLLFLELIEISPYGINKFEDRKGRVNKEKNNKKKENNKNKDESNKNKKKIFQKKTN